MHFRFPRKVDSLPLDALIERRLISVATNSRVTRLIGVLLGRLRCRTLLCMNLSMNVG